ncbi:hypothetical protein OKW33_001051 [Paraburkholderia atlantica]
MDDRVRRQIGAGGTLDHRDVDRAERADDLGRVAVGGMHGDVRKAPMEFGDQVRQQVARRRRARADPQSALLQTAQRVAIRMRLPPGVAQPRRIAGELLAGRRQPHAAAIALIQRLAELVLQLPQLSRHRRLG